MNVNGTCFNVLKFVFGSWRFPIKPPKNNVLFISEPHGELFCFILPTLGARYEYFNNQNYFVYLYATFVSNHRQSNSKLHHAAAEMNKVDVLYSIGMKSSNNFVITAINKII